MKRLISLLAIAVMTVATSLADITLHVSNRPAESVFAEIMKQSGHNFVYSSGLLRGVTVSVDADREPLGKVLDDMFRNTGISWKRKGNNILLSRSSERQAAKVTVSGFVKEAGSEEPLAGVAIYSPESKTGTSTNALGYYSLSLPAGKATLKFSYPSFNPRQLELTGLTSGRTVNVTLEEAGEMLNEVTVYGSVNRSLAMDATAIGAINVSHDAIVSTPVIFGESDVIKTLQLEPGVSAGVEGMAGMFVHGGNTDENLYMLDNIPLYQINHFGGLFSAFNTEALRNVDFYKSTFPARYDGRLSSFMDVRTKDGSMESRHGSFKLGLTSGAFNIDGPLWKGHTSYSVAVRRSWYDLLTIPLFAIYNSFSKDEKYNIGYAFTDVNLKVNHHFSDRSSAHIMAYYGDDYLRVSQSFDKNKENADFDEFKSHLRWGNLVISGGWNYVFSTQLFGELTAAYTRYSSRLNHAENYGTNTGGQVTSYTSNEMRSDNNINDWIVKADFNWHPAANHYFDFGAGVTRHSFLPSRTVRDITSDTLSLQARDVVRSYGATEANLYISGDWQPADALRVDYGAHYSLFNIEGKTHQNLSPRISARWTPAPGWAVKGGYSRTVQYVHQIMQSSISLPTDQWVPIVATQKPQTADKVAAGVYYSTPGGLTFSVEGYWKWMKNLLEYADEYYLMPPDTEWSDKLTTGTGTSKGIDFKVAKEFGKVSGHVAYSLLWADRCYPDRNHGRPFPARFDNRHKINVMLNWKISDKWEMSASWTGMSGNRYTLVTQMWRDPQLGPWHYDMLLETDINNYRLPFYHRMDIGFKRHTKHGYWDFSLYNAYCNMNTIAVRRDYAVDSYFDPSTGSFTIRPEFQKVKLIPVIPSVSYTWLF